MCQDSFYSAGVVTHGRRIGCRYETDLLRSETSHPGANPTIVSYNASAVEIYNVTSAFKKNSSLIETL
jgi:hypothetical protein